MSQAGKSVAGSEFSGFRCGRRAIGVSPRSQQRTDVELRLCESGSVTLLVQGRVQKLPPQRLALIWAGVPHQVIAHDAVEGWSARVPLSWLIQCRLPDQLPGRLLEGHVVFEPDIAQFESDLCRFRQWTRDLESGGQAPLRAVELEVEARLVRLTSMLPGKRVAIGEQRRGVGRERSKALELAAMIAARHADSFSMTEFARGAGLHRNYAMNLFRRELGTTLLEYLTQHRLAHAMRELVASDRSLEETAAGSGFGSLNRFRTVFGRAFKEAPAAFRRRHRRRA